MQPWSRPIRSCFHLSVILLSLAAARTSADAPPIRGFHEIDVSAIDELAPQIDVDVLAVPIFDGEESSEMTESLQRLGFRDLEALEVISMQHEKPGKVGQATSLYAPSGAKARRLLLVGAGDAASFDAEAARRLAGRVVRLVLEDRVRTLGIWGRDLVFSTTGEVVAAALTEGAVLATFDPGLHKTDHPPVTLEGVVLASLGSPMIGPAIERASLMARATNLARSLTQEPANYMTPETLAAHAKAIADRTDLDVQIFEEEEIQRLGMGGVMAVGKGSVNRPRFIVLHHAPSEPSKIKLALVGKGVCFDTGGHSLKSGSHVYTMKGDMAGGATVLAAMEVIARLDVPIEVLGIVPAVENVPGSMAQKQGDVFTTFDGTTVEVMSTDAEGRMILSDGLGWAVAQGATHLVDVATLTGTVGRALGAQHTGAFSNDDDLYDLLALASSKTGESLWRLPLGEAYRKGLEDSLVADLNETGGKAGASIGAEFLQTFVDERPWVHLDIAGTSWPAESAKHRADGPTGVGVRTLAVLAELLSGQSAPSD